MRSKAAPLPWVVEAELLEESTLDIHNPVSSKSVAIGKVGGSRGVHLGSVRVTL
jgi:hypothetical protein